MKRKAPPPTTQQQQQQQQQQQHQQPLGTVTRCRRSGVVALVVVVAVAVAVAASVGMPMAYTMHYTPYRAQPGALGTNIAATPTPTSNSRAVASVIAACMGRHSALARALPSWRRIRGVGEIILVDWSSEPELTLALDPPDNDPPTHLVRVDKEPRWVLSRAYNLAASRASFPLLLKVDCDYLSTNASFLEEHFSPDDASRARVFLAGDWRSAKSANELHLNGLLVLRKADFDAVGGFDERIQTYGWDDTDLHARLERDGVSRRELKPGKWFTHLPHSDGARSLPNTPANNQTGDVAPFILVQTNRLLLAALKHPWSAHDRLGRGSTYSYASTSTRLSATFIPPALATLVPAPQLLSAQREARTLYLSRFGLPRSFLREFHSETVLLPLTKEFHARARAGNYDAPRLLVIHVTSGLGNRMRTLASGVSLARRQGRVPVVVWEANDHCDARFAELFDASALRGVVVLDAWPFAWPFPSQTRFPASQAWTKAFDIVNLVASEERAGVDAGLQFTSRGNFKGKIRNRAHKHLYVRTPSLLYLATNKPDPANVLMRTELVPVPEVRGKVEELARRFGLRESSVVGVHVRTRPLSEDVASVDPVKEYSPRFASRIAVARAKSANVSLVVVEMVRRVRSNGVKRFFVSADAPGVVEEIRAELGGVEGLESVDVVEQPDACRDATRTLACVRSALVDVSCLGLTPRLLGSPHSSFSEVACRLAEGADAVAWDDRQHMFVVGVGFVDACDVS